MLTLATSELCQTGLVPFSKANISRTTGTWQVPVVLLISAFKNGTKPVWHSSEVASVNTLLVSSKYAYLFLKENQAFSLNKVSMLYATCMPVYNLAAILMVLEPI